MEDKKKHTAFSVPIKFATPKVEKQFAEMLSDLPEAESAKIFESFAAAMNEEEIPEGVSVRLVDLDELADDTRREVEEALAAIDAKKDPAAGE